MSTSQFADLPLSQEMLANLESLGYHQMTPIQAQSLPVTLEGRDLIAKAKTGSGKTAAFGIGLLNKLNVKRFRIQGLILCPTRELADQVAKEIRRLARFTHNIKVLTLCGGVPFGPQLGSLDHGAHIIVGTPGRVLDHLNKRTLNLDDLHTLVLDEADRMLDMGFADTLDAILHCAPAERQTLLFSATYPAEIKQMSAHIQREPVEVSIDVQHSQSHITQHYFEIDKDQRLNALTTLLGHHQPQSSVIFCNTKRQCQEVADHLANQGYSALALHGDLEQRDRDQVLVRFANQSCTILVATDVAARGLDIKELDLVISYELTRDPEVHVHRVGRTGRAGSKGLALHLCPPSEIHRVHAIEAYNDTTAQWQAIESLTVPYGVDLQPPMVTLCIDGGKKNKIRPGDILGALTGDAGIAGDQVGKIDIFPFHSYVAVHRNSARKALGRLANGKIKGRKLRVRPLNG